MVRRACNGSDVEVSIAAGYPVLYEICSPNLGTVYYSQDSTFFADVPVGTYKIRVTDTCGNTRTLDLVSEALDYTYTWNDYAWRYRFGVDVDYRNMASCDSIICYPYPGFSFGTGSSLSECMFPIEVTVTVTTPSGTYCTS